MLGFIVQLVRAPQKWLSSWSLCTKLSLMNGDETGAAWFVALPYVYEELLDAIFLANNKMAWNFI